MTASIYLERPKPASGPDTSRMVTAEMWRKLALRHSWAARHAEADTCLEIAARIDAQDARR